MVAVIVLGEGDDARVGVGRALGLEQPITRALDGLGGAGVK